MSANITARVILLDDRCDMPDGTYQGVWSAYSIDVPMGPVTLQTASTPRWVNGVPRDIPVRITVTRGRASVMEA